VAEESEPQAGFGVECRVLQRLRGWRRVGLGVWGSWVVILQTFLGLFPSHGWPSGGSPLRIEN
jgi:hypothetical protein